MDNTPKPFKWLQLDSNMIRTYSLKPFPCVHKNLFEEIIFQYNGQGFTLIMNQFFHFINHGCNFLIHYLTLWENIGNQKFVSEYHQLNNSIKESSWHWPLTFIEMLAIIPALVLGAVSLIILPLLWVLPLLGLLVLLSRTDPLLELYDKTILPFWSSYRLDKTLSISSPY